ncbi:MAG: glycosyltransferase family 4 protein [Pseudomonadales bacterium]
MDESEFSNGTPLSNLDGGESWGKPGLARRLIARTGVLVLSSIVLTVSGFAWIRQRLGLQPAPRNRDLLMIGTFYNPAWYNAHATPLTKVPAIGEVYVVCDEPFSAAIDGVQFVCPTPDQRQRYGRSAARLLALLSFARKHRPMFYMGYHLMPNSLMAVVTAKLFGGFSFYQMTGGPAQLIGGGYQGENPLLNACEKPSRLQERLLFSVARRFDSIVVRGSNAKRYVETNRLSRHPIIITGAMTPDSPDKAPDPKSFDLLCVGRLVPVKGYPLLLDAFAELQKLRPGTTLGIIGGGPFEQAYHDTAARYGIADWVTFIGKVPDVESYLRSARLFVLFSENEGLSIAMLEAMSFGIPVFVKNVGDLADPITTEPPGGWLIADQTPAEIAQELTNVLSTDLEQTGQVALRTITEHYSVTAISKRWDDLFKQF